ncbi:MAG: MFS transporter [Alphaproteobacteria bacterium]|nr:MFS transporter [Alphaproteobacteria bacterium]MBU0799289.1 MFS transporter [Alphaproteobacteria bacterium]MBU0887178.1 MFS transporter [Alphaproteobacteria bacterium]MBU1814428.1 MFS transporter [Alphaproteobacteria bacterium]MBU2090915.1 MFS transporter [Alphaproteobacteria bacterium]
MTEQPSQQPVRPPGAVEPARLILAVLGLTFVMNMVARGMGETFAVFLLPVQQDSGWSRADMTGVYSIYMLVHGLSAPLAGLLFDRLGSRWLYATGVCLLGGGFFLAGEANTLWQYYLAAGVMVGTGVSAMGMVPASALLSRWFTGRLGSVMGLAYAAMGMGVLILLPATQLLLEHMGWRDVYHVLGLAILTLLLPVILLPLARLTRGSDAWRHTRTIPAAQSPWTLKTALRTRAFWGLFFVFFFTSFAAYSILPQAVAYLVELGFDPITAASAFGFTGLLSVVGMVSVGWLSDRFGRRLTVTLSYASSLTGIFCIIAVAWYPSLILVYGFVLFFGISQGARGPVVSTLAAVLFPGGGIGGIYGAITLGLGLGGAAGSWGSGLLQEMTGGYFLSFSLAAVASALGLLQFWVIRALGEPDRGR